MRALFDWKELKTNGDGMIPAVVPLTGVEMMYKATGASVG